jgi:hypothetical protein
VVLEASPLLFEHPALYGKHGEEWRILLEKDFDFLKHVFL